jgi:hypothetical protein
VTADGPPGLAGPGVGADQDGPLVLVDGRSPALDVGLDVVRVVGGAAPAGHGRPATGRPSSTRLEALPPGPLYLREGVEGWTALTPAVVLAGWRETPDALRLLGLLSISKLDGVCLRMAGTAALPGVPAGLGSLSALVALISWPRASRPELLADIAVALAALDPAVLPGEAARALRAVRQLVEAHPRDPAILTPLLLRAIELDPGEGIELGPGTARLLLSGTVTAQSGHEAVVGALSRDHGGVAARPIQVTAFAGLLASESDVRRTCPPG